VITPTGSTCASGGIPASSIYMSTSDPTFVTTNALYSGVTTDSQTVTQSNTSVYGAGGVALCQVVINAGISSITVDGNIEQVLLPGASSYYKYLQNGLQIEVFDGTTSALILTAAIHNASSTGTNLTFADGTVNVVITGGILKFGGTSVSSSSATALTPGTITSSVTSMASPVQRFAKRVGDITPQSGDYTAAMVGAIAYTTSSGRAVTTPSLAFASFSSQYHANPPLITTGTVQSNSTSTFPTDNQVATFSAYSCASGYYPRKLTILGGVTVCSLLPSISLTGTSSQLSAGNGSAVTIGSGLSLSGGTLTATSGGSTSGTSILYGNGSGGFSNVTIGANLTFSGGTLSASALSAIPNGVTATTQTSLDGSTKIATDAYVDSEYSTVFQNSQSAAYTCVLSDAGKQIYHPSTDVNARTFTIPANSSVAYPVGTVLTFINMASQVVSIAITTDTMYLAGTGTTGTRSLNQCGMATAIKIDSTHWLISGGGLT
jgi:hypothetical protein